MSLAEISMREEVGLLAYSPLGFWYFVWEIYKNPKSCR